ncbi:MAG: right-handed parallel beta-helix repeat-containing protein, partial [Gammaproteobacteria bacterium]|nr:right-handed parallel beta-helix repeat-containing protein [Gammaproteobacteria bacterium]
DGTYTGLDNKNLDFGGLAITLKSENGPNTCIIDCENSGRGFYFHSGEDANSVLSGFTITRGKATGNPSMGGGIYCSGSSPTIENCIISDNSALGNSGPFGGDGYDGYGGGIYCQSGSYPRIVGCKIINNTATGGDGGDGWCSPMSEPMPTGNGGSGYGGGIYCSSDSTIEVENCTVYNNMAKLGWGGVDGAGVCSPGTEGAAYGGGIYCLGSSSITNCLVISNLTFASFAIGGGIFSNNTTIRNCTICYNHSFDASAVKGQGTSMIINSILWGNANAGVKHATGCSVTYSCTDYDDTGEGNIQADPCFVSGFDGDYYLSQTAAGQATDSPCVNMGSDTAVNLGMDIFTTRTDKVWDEGFVDMGYHYSGNLADLNDSGHVDLGDFAILASQWQDVPNVPSADIAPDGGDGVVDEKDLGIFCDNWLWGQ